MSTGSIEKKDSSPVKAGENTKTDEFLKFEEGYKQNQSRSALWLGLAMLGVVLLILVFHMKFGRV